MAKTAKISRTKRLLFTLQFCAILCTAFYTRDSCPPSIRGLMDECTCMETRTSIYIRCSLGGATYSQLPTFGKINVTVRQITIEQGTIGNLHDGVFDDLLVSVALNIYYMCLHRTSLEKDCVGLIFAFFSKIYFTQSFVNLQYIMGLTL